MQNIIADIHPKGNKEIKDNRWAEGEKWDIDEIFAYAAGGNVQFFPDIGANAKYVPFY